MRLVNFSFVRRSLGLAGLATFALLSSAFGAQQLLISTGAVWRYFDAGMQPASNWMARTFFDLSWKSGRAELGFGDGDEVTVISNAPNGTPLITAYFRRTFFVNDPATVSNLHLQLFRDDGAVVYINGTEVLRDNMPPGPVSYSTLAVTAAPDDGNVPVLATIPPTPLVRFTNVIAVEIHQNALTSSDLSFDLLLLAETMPPPNRPPVAHSQSVITRQNTPVAITLTGSDPDGNAITFAITSFPTHGTLTGTPPNVTYTPDTDYIGPDSFTFIVNDGQLNSAPATVSIQVLPPPDPPEVVSAIADCSAPEVIVTFNEPVNQFVAEDVFNYFIGRTDGGFAPAIVSASLGPDQQTVTLGLDSPLIPGISYFLEVAVVCDISGDCAFFQNVPIQFETEPPLVACSVAVDTLFPANNQLVDVGLSASSSEGNLQVQVFSDEAELAFLEDAVLADGILQLRARKAPSSNGRVYLIVVTSIDGCGNVGVCCTTVVVPAGGSQEALDVVNAEAAAAEAQCSPAGSPSTPHPILP